MALISDVLKTEDSCWENKNAAFDLLKGQVGAVSEQMSVRVTSEEGCLCADMGQTEHGN